MTFRLLLPFTILIFGSCSANKEIFTAERFQNISQLTVDRATRWNLSQKHKDISPNHLILIGEDIYPNSKNFNLAKPRTFEKKTNSFRISTDYYYSAPDSIVRVILYQWDKARTSDQKAEFQKQFNKLRKYLTTKLGEPTEIEINQKEFNYKTFRDGIKWTGKVNAYLFMFGRDQNEYRQIRLAIYCD